MLTQALCRVDYDRIPHLGIIHKNGTFLVTNFAKVNIIRTVSAALGLPKSKALAPRPYTMELYHGGLEMVNKIATIYVSLGPPLVKRMKYRKGEGFKMICDLLIVNAKYTIETEDVIRHLEEVLEIELKQKEEK